LGAPRIFYFNFDPAATYPLIYHTPSDVRALFVEIVGGGAAGTFSGGAYNPNECSCGGGGGAGGYAAMMIPWTSNINPVWDFPLEAEYPFQVGYGGDPFNLPLPPGPPYPYWGGNTWFGPLTDRWQQMNPGTSLHHHLEANGGICAAASMGNGSNPETVYGSQGGGGLAPPHGATVGGNWGDPGIRIGAEIAIGGRGGDSYMSTGGGAWKVFSAALSPSGAGFDGTGYGCGGGGGISWFGVLHPPPGHIDIQTIRGRNYGGWGFPGCIKISEYT
jgi:hypothetical protein